MGLSDLVNRAKDLVQKRGGTGALKEDAQELKDIAKSEGTTSEKLKKGADALKEPGAKRPEPGAERPAPGADRPDPGAERPDPGASERRQ